MLSAQWLNEMFPDDVYVPQRSRLPSESGPRAPLRGRQYFIEEETFGARFGFVQKRPAETTIALLKEIKKGWRLSTRSLDLQPGSKGGRKPLTYRHDLIINLAEIWKMCGGKVSTTASSPFAAFCENETADTDRMAN